MLLTLSFKTIFPVIVPPESGKNEPPEAVIVPVTKRSPVTVVPNNVVSNLFELL